MLDPTLRESARDLVAAHRRLGISRQGIETVLRSLFAAATFMTDAEREQLIKEALQ